MKNPGKPPYAVYRPDNSLQRGYVSAFGEILQELNENRWLMVQLFKRDILATYKQSFFGIFWAILMPLASVGTFVLLNRSGLFSLGDLEVPYPIYAVLGMAFWQVFATGLVGSSNSLVQAGSMLTQIRFSRKSLVLASAGQSLVSFLIQFVLLGTLFIYYRQLPSAGILWVPFLLLPILAITLGLGLILSLLNGIIRDVTNMLSLFLTFGLFLTPILYAPAKTGILTEVTRYNPLHYLISGARETVLSGGMAEPRAYAVSALISAALLLFCLMAFHLTEARLAERV
jgi:lipopolysaccharide transport system permease protein